MYVKPFLAPSIQLAVHMQQDLESIYGKPFFLKSHINYNFVWFVQMNYLNQLNKLSKIIDSKIFQKISLP
jgi:hypothetical protein